MDDANEINEVGELRMSTFQGSTSRTESTILIRWPRWTKPAAKWTRSKELVDEVGEFDEVDEVVNDTNEINGVHLGLTESASSTRSQRWVRGGE